MLLVPIWQAVVEEDTRTTPSRLWSASHEEATATGNWTTATPTFMPHCTYDAKLVLVYRYKSSICQCHYLYGSSYAFIRNIIVWQPGIHAHIECLAGGGPGQLR
jgi:hypothetical protein